MRVCSIRRTRSVPPTIVWTIGLDLLRLSVVTGVVVHVNDVYGEVISSYTAVIVCPALFRIFAELGLIVTSVDGIVLKLKNSELLQD